MVATGSTSRAQTPQQTIAAAVQSEIAADRADHSNWLYRHRDITPDADTLTLVAESPQGSVKRKLEDHGRPLTPAQVQQETARIRAFAADQSRQQKSRHDEKHDDDEAETMLRLLPVAFLWEFRGQQGDLATLAFRPNPGFTPHTLTARVLSAMAGEVVIARPHASEPTRIQSIQGTLTEDVTFGWGLLGRLRQGGSFHVERSEVAPDVWQITASHIHIEGRALLFKMIGEQEDETMYDFHPSPARNIPEAAAELGVH